MSVQDTALWRLFWWTGHYSDQFRGRKFSDTPPPPPVLGETVLVRFCVKMNASFWKKHIFLNWILFKCIPKNVLYNLGCLVGCNYYQTFNIHVNYIIGITLDRNLLLKSKMGDTSCIFKSNDSYCYIHRWFNLKERVR